MRGADVPMPSFQPGKGNEIVLSQQAGRAIVYGIPERAMICSPMLFVYV
jgi:hypothetical protein